MLPLQSSSKLPQSTLSGLESNNDKTLEIYPELPSVKSYHELENHCSFPMIQSWFLKDIEMLKQLAIDYVGEQYNSALDIFLANIRTPDDYIKEALLPLYRDVRLHIHQLVVQLTDSKNNSPNIQSDQKERTKKYIASTLHECLEDIDLCPAGVHSRFTRTFLNLQIASQGMRGTLYRVRDDLYSEFINSFLIQQEREGIIDIAEDMWIHWFNSLYNICCKSLNLKPIDDPLTPCQLDDSIADPFLSAAPLHVNAHTTIRCLATKWAEWMAQALEQMGVSTWQTDSIESSEMTADKIGILDSTLFKPVNQMLGTSAKLSLDIWTVVEENSDGTYRLSRYREKLLAFAAQVFFKPNGTVFTVIPNSGADKKYIGTIDHVYFWVFECDRHLHTGDTCNLETDNHISLQLSHLTSLDFSSWIDTTGQALLIQAMAQTARIDSVLSFISNPNVIEQLTKMPSPVVQMLSHQLSDKLLRTDSIQKEALCRELVDQLACATPERVPFKTLTLLIETPLLEPLLSELIRNGKEISQITSQLDSWQIADFSTEGIKKILPPEDCQRLFVQANYLLQTNTLSHLLLTGHCDQLIDQQLDDDVAPPIYLFARGGILPGLRYLLNLDNAPVNWSDDFGRTPLHRAARYGHWRCVRELLKREDAHADALDHMETTPLLYAIQSGHHKCVREIVKNGNVDINQIGMGGFTPLHLAALFDHALCIRELLQAPNIHPNRTNDSGLNPLTLAARQGFSQSVKELLKAENILVNEQTSSGWTALLYAIHFGHTECVRELLGARQIQVNQISSSWLSPLHTAIFQGSGECLRELLQVENIQINQPNRNITPLHHAVMEGNLEPLQLLLGAEEIHVNAKSKNGLTPLHLAIYFNRAECVRALLGRQDIQVNSQDNEGYSPLSLAVMTGHFECVEELLKAPGIQPLSLPPSVSYTPIARVVLNRHYCCIWELAKSENSHINHHQSIIRLEFILLALTANIECVEDLLEAPDAELDKAFDFARLLLNNVVKHNIHQIIPGLTRTERIHLNEKDNTGCTPLNSAAQLGYHECVQALLNCRDIKINESNTIGWTPLHNAANNGHRECIRALLGAENIRVNEQDNEGYTPLCRAALRGHIDSVRELLKVPGIEIDKKNNAGLTPLDLATQNENHDCAHELTNARTPV